MDKKEIEDLDEWEKLLFKLKHLDYFAIIVLFLDILVAGGFLYFFWWYTFIK